MTRLPDDAPVHAPVDAPVDPGDVVADDAAVEALRSRPAHLRPGDDLALLLVQELLRDVTGEDARPGAPVLRVVGGPSSRARPRRALRSGAVVAALAAGVLSVGGAAAAAAPEGSPLRGVGDAVRSVAGAVVDAVAPARSSQPEDEAPRTSRAASPSEASPAAPAVRQPLPSAAETTAAIARSAPGAAAAAARATGAERAVVSLLDSAARQLALGRPGPAAGMLDTAERRLPEVGPARAADLGTRLAALRAVVAAAQAAPEPDRGPPAVRTEPRPVAPGRAAPPAAEPAPEPAAEQPTGRTGPAQPVPRGPGSARSSLPPGGPGRG